MYKVHPMRMPDVATQKSTSSYTSIDWVGMGSLRFPLHCHDGEYHWQTNADCDVFVNLPAGGERGIHMSRLYLLVEALRGCTKAELSELVDKLIYSHLGKSDSARICLSFDCLIKRNALISDNNGWRSYPIALEVISTPTGKTFTLQVSVDYSSTCPCSKALAEQVILNKFDQEMATQSQLDASKVRLWLENNAIYASPHSQRSTAVAKVFLQDEDQWGIVSLIDTIENTLQTAVQSAVKREDEQQFAIANGQNPMFCEDAVRNIKNALLDTHQRFEVRVDHFESLHAHNAVAMCVYP